MTGERLAVGEQKQSPAPLQFSARFNEMVHAFRAVRYREDAKTAETESPTMNFLRPCGFVGQQLSIKGTLRQGAAENGHGPTVGFEKIEHALEWIAAVGGFENESAVGHDIELAKPLQLPVATLPVLLRPLPDVA